MNIKRDVRLPLKITQKQLKGVVYTPKEVARELTKLSCAKKNLSNTTVLEPSIGNGEFLKALLNLGVKIKNTEGIDVSKIAIRQLKDNFGEVNLFHEDFISFSLKQSVKKYDVVIGNPPYIRRHNYTKKLYYNISRLSKITGYPLSDLKNAWAAFIIAAFTQLKPDGVLAFILPYELMNVGYGKKMQLWLNKNFKRVDIFIPQNKAFPEIEQDAIALIARNDCLFDDGFFMHKVNCLSSLDAREPHEIKFHETLSMAIEQKKFLLKPETVKLLHNLKGRLDRVSDFCESTTGIVTAANNFFILTEEEVAQHNLAKWVKPILKKASYLPKSVDFTKRDLHVLRSNEPCFVLDFRDTKFNELDSDAKKYVKLGESLDLHLRFKCRNRTPWYGVPILPQTEGFFFKRSHLLPRICVNKAKILVTDTAYRIRMKPSLKIKDLGYSFYNSLTLLFTEIDGRFYGGGVLELTPNEFKNLPIVFVKSNTTDYKAFSKAIKEELLSPNDFFAFGDEWLKQKMQLSNRQMKMLQDALLALRSHRLRHGGRC